MTTFKRVSLAISFLPLCMFLCLVCSTASGQNKREHTGNTKRDQTGDTKYVYTPDESYISTLSFATVRDNLVSAVNLAEQVFKMLYGGEDFFIKNKKDNINLITEVNVTETQFEIRYNKGKEQKALVFNYSKSKMPDAFEVDDGKRTKSFMVKDGVNGFWILWNDEGTAVKNAKLFLDAVYYLKTVFTAQKIEKFKEKAEIYKSMDPKPEISEDMRKCIVQATALTKDKKYDEAIKLYEKAMEIDETFPDAHFNLALLYAQVNDFSSAIIEMKKYLMLVPDAKDARAAQDKIYEWEVKVK
jgi:tetratricopeptide (TPR) repeat protein